MVSKVCPSAWRLPLTETAVVGAIEAETLVGTDPALGDRRRTVALWRHGKCPHTIRAYGGDVAAFRAFTGKGLRAAYLSRIQTSTDTGFF